MMPAGRRGRTHEPGVRAQETPLMTPHMLAIDLARLVNERDLAAAKALFTPDAEVCFPRYAPRTVFRGGELEELYDWMVARIPVYTMAVDRITASEPSA